MTIAVKDATGTSQTINTLPALGLAGAAASLPVVLASDGNHARASDIAQVVQALGSLSVGISGPAAVTQSGAWTVALAPNTTVSLTGGNTVALKVDGSGVTQPVSITALPLPSGAATAAKQDAMLTALGGTLTVQGAVTVSDGAGPLSVDGTVSVSNFPATQAISASALPLPSGAATSAAQGTGNSSLSSIDTKTPALVTGRVPVDGSGVTQPISASALPLPSGAATDSKVEALRALSATSFGTPADTATPDITASGASFTFASLLKGIVANGFALLARFPASLGAKTSSASLSITPASDAAFPAPADQDPIFNHAAGAKVAITTTSATLITPPTGTKYVRVSTDADVVLNTAGQAAVDDGTTIRIYANAPEVIPVVAGTIVTALSLSGTANVRATPLKVR